MGSPDLLDVREVLDRSTGQAVPSLANLGEATRPHVEELVVPRDLSFTLSYRPPGGGAELRGTVVSRVPTFDMQLRMARAEVDLCGGRPIESFAYDKQQWMRMLARVTCQTIKPPDWFNEWIGQDADFLREIYDRCVAHSVLFFRPDAAAGGPAESGARMAISSALDSRLETLRSVP